ncbi:MAG: peptidylprolyl isomerase [Calditrichaeota bacterium]|nr:peptidylprolyl isomerase [Calditrichota bacterium]MCB9068473.1 peptidylprolyl isomerase [Calditrichia bacterium]
MIRQWILQLGAVAMLLTPALAQQPIDGVAAVVGKEIILISDINTMLTQYAMQNKVNPFKDEALLNRLSKQVLDRMIDEKLLLIRAEEDTLIAEDERVDQVVEQQVNGFMQQAGSQEALEEYYGMSLPLIKREMRKRVANQIVIEKLRDRQFGSINVSRREVEKFYTQYQDSMPRIGETANISHILMKVKPSDDAIGTAMEKITRIRQMLDEGQDFGELALKYSEDPSAKSNKGNLGWTSRGDFVKEFEEAAYALEVDEISDIVQSQFGFHIIQLLNRQGEKINARHILIQLQPTAADEQKTVEKLKEIRQKILNGEATFGEMALEYSDDPNVQQDRGDLGDFEVNNFQVKAFEQALKTLKVGDISEPVRTEFGYHIIKLNKKNDARVLTLEKDWQQIENIAKEYKRNQAFEDMLKNLRENVPIDVKIQI